MSLICIHKKDIEQHKASFEESVRRTLEVSLMTKTTLAVHIWNLKDDVVRHTLKWSIIDRNMTCSLYRVCKIEK